MKEFNLDDKIYYPSIGFGTIRKNIANVHHEYDCEVAFESGNTIIIPQSDLFPVEWNESFGHERHLLNVMSSVILPPPVNKKGKALCFVGIGGNEGDSVPHFHVFNTKHDAEHWYGGTCIMFTENRYFNHKDHNGQLTKDQLEGVVRLLKSNKRQGLTYWQYLIDTWNADIMRTKKLPDDLPMPDYDYRTIKRYKED